MALILDQAQKHRIQLKSFKMNKNLLRK